MKTSTDRILTTHVGSLVRTPDIVELHIQKYLGEVTTPEQFQEAIRRGVQEVVKRQADIGVDIVDDGEYGKLNWIAYLGQRLKGTVTTDIRVAPEDGAKFWPEQDRYAEFYAAYLRHESVDWLPAAPSRDRYMGTQMTDYQNLVCRAELEYMPGPLSQDIANLTEALRNVRVEDAFMPVVAPGSIEIITNEYYKTEEDYLFALARELNKEYRQIADAGYVLQVDDAVVPAMYYYRFLGQPLKNYLDWAELRIEALNRALRGIPASQVRYHVCFGSQNMPHTTDPAMADLMPTILKVNAGAYAIEASNCRHFHEVDIWKSIKLPPGKVLIPGFVGHATNVVEHPDLVAQRIVAFAELVGRENVLAGTDCGFSQGWNSPRVHAQVQWAKLETLVEGARRASRRLWGK